MNVRSALAFGVLVSSGLGLGMSTGSPVGLAVSILAPVVWLRQHSRAASYICAVAYHCCALRSLPFVSRNFFDPESGLPEGLCFWIIAATILSVPWLWVWTPSKTTSLWRCPLGLLLTIIPPLGLIGWASPTAAAGLLFPATGYPGFVFNLCLPGLILSGRKFVLAAVLAGILLAHVLSGPAPKVPTNWEAINTCFGPISHARVSLVREYEIEHEVQNRAIHSRARVVIFPEAVVPEWTAATDLFWSDTTIALRRAGKVILVGALTPQVRSEGFDFRATLAALQSPNLPPEHMAEPEISESSSYENEVMIRGAQTGNFVQRVPVPIGMWKPFTRGGVPLELSNPGTVLIAGRRTAVIICYEQLIAWPVLVSFLEHPSVVVAILTTSGLSERLYHESKKALCRLGPRYFTFRSFLQQTARLFGFVQPAS